MRWVSARVALLVALVALVALPVVGVGAGVGVGVAHAQVVNIESAKNHFAAGKAYYDETRWEDALREFQEAYRLSKRPALLYNIALCNERLLRYDEAVETLRTYLRIDPNAEGKVDIERKIVDLDEARRNTRPGERPPALPVRPAGGASTPKSAPPAPSVVPTPSSTATAPVASAPTPAPAPRRRVATWIVGAAGLALLAAGAGTAVVSHDEFQTLLDQCGPTHATCPQGFEAARDRGQRLQWASAGLLAAGGAAVVGAVVLYFFEGRQTGESRVKPRAQVVPMLVPAGAGVTGSIEF